MIKLKSIIQHLPEFDKLHTLIQQRELITVEGIHGSLLSLVVDFLSQIKQEPVLVVLPDSDAAEKLADDLKSFLPENLISYLPSDEVVPFDTGIFTPAVYSLRLNALLGILTKEARIVITTATALLRRLPEPETLKLNMIYLKVEEEFGRDLLIEWLAESGFERAPTIEEVGQYSVRGGIVDCFSYDADTPVRIEFFGDTVESIREFDVLSQLSIGQIKRTRLLGRSANTDESATLFDFFPEKACLFWMNFEQCRTLLREFWDAALKKSEAASGSPGLQPIEQRYLPLPGLFSQVDDLTQIKLVRLEKSGGTDLNFQSGPPPVFQGNIKLLAEHLRKYLKSTGPNLPSKLYILYESKSARERLEEFLEAEMGFLPPLKFLEGSLHNGFTLPQHQLEVLTDHEIFNRLRMRRRRRRIRVTGSLIRNLKSLSYGDFVVHVDYGIGKYVGTERLKVAGIEKDCLKLLYQDNDVLYVNLDKLNHIQKYTSEEGYQPRLTRLGSAEWDRVKKKTRNAVENVARELVQLYAARMSQKGFSASPDTLWQKELEASFPFEDTPDQAQATREVKEDMESGKPMDRLICGDVGFGKTEIAIRAAFKAVMDGKQVAVLVPTTILAQQHFNTFSERLRNFPIRVDVISRFRSRAEQKVVLESLASGETDIIIGTHRLLSADVAFKELGLLVVDEEQRFGVTHKEKLKTMKITVDTLALTATPIPRTLHLSLMGARDLSNVDTPPQNRRPIVTEITSWDPQLIYKAITWEMERGGQVFFVHNRVQTIEGMAGILRNLLPQARIAVAHGQMREKQLEKIMTAFYHKEYDVLLATMIIENGLDIPNCNTIIINRADQFGLAQLYQLRGRVGRSERQAYAYLIIPPQDRLNETAIKRLYAIEEFGELGAGLKIAMRDLEIRGAGNLLGHQQSGYINAVGFDLYQKILQETVETMQEETLPETYIQNRMPHVDAAVDFDSEMYIPDDYIDSPSEKVAVYHRLLNLDNQHLIDNLAMELRDRFGPLPLPVQCLIDMVKIKKLASGLYVRQVRIRKQKMTLTFDDKATRKEQFVESELPRYINQEITSLNFRQGKSLSVEVSIKGNTPMDRISFAKNFLSNI